MSSSVFNIEMPNISATDTNGKIEQIKSYLQQNSEYLEWALNHLSLEQTSKINTIMQDLKQIKEKLGIL